MLFIVECEKINNTISLLVKEAKKSKRLVTGFGYKNGTLKHNFASVCHFLKFIEYNCSFSFGSFVLARDFLVFPRMRGSLALLQTFLASEKGRLD